MHSANHWVVYLQRAIAFRYNGVERIEFVAIELLQLDAPMPMNWMNWDNKLAILSRGACVAIGLVTLVTIGCSGDNDVEKELPRTNSPTLQQRDRGPGYRLLALGDSYTIGEAVAESERWPVQLAKMLRRDGVELEVVTFIARTGWTSGELLAGISSARPTSVFEIVTLQIGVNDQFRRIDESQYVRDLDKLFDLAIEFAGGDPSRVVVLSIPDWSVTPFPAVRDRRVIASEIDRFNQLKRERADRLGCHFVDVTPISREAVDDPSLLADDGLHPSGKMYARWCELALPAARRALSSADKD